MLYSRSGHFTKKRKKERKEKKEREEKRKGGNASSLSRPLPARDEAADLGRVSGAQAAPGQLTEPQGSLWAQARRGGAASPPAGFRPHTRPLGPEPRSGCPEAGGGQLDWGQRHRRRWKHAGRRGPGLGEERDRRTGGPGGKAGGGDGGAGRGALGPGSPARPGAMRERAGVGGGGRASSPRPARALSPPTAGRRGRGRGAAPPAALTKPTRTKWQNS